MVVVIVAEQDSVDRRQGIKSEAGRLNAVRSGPRDGTGAVGEKWIGEEIAVGGLEEVGRVADPGGDDLVGARHGRRRLRCEWHAGRPACGAGGEFPAQESEAAAAGEGIEGQIGFPVELGGGRRCHRGVVTINRSFSTVQTGECRREEVPCA